MMLTAIVPPSSRSTWSRYRWSQATEAELADASADEEAEWSMGEARQ